MYILPFGYSASQHKNRPGFLLRKPGRFVMLYSCFLKRSRNHLRGFLIAACSALYKQRVQENAHLRYLFFIHFVIFSENNTFLLLQFSEQTTTHFFIFFPSIFFKNGTSKNFPYHKKEVFFHMNTPIQLKIRGHTK